MITQALVDEAEAVHGNEGRTEIIQYMWHNEPQFKTGLEGLKQAVTQKSATYKALKKKEKEMVKNLEEAVEPFLDNIREKVKAAKLQYKASPEYKDHSRSEKSHGLKWSAFRNKWDIGVYSIRMALGGIAAARSFIPTNIWRYRRRSDAVFNVTVR